MFQALFPRNLASGPGAPLFSSGMSERGPEGQDWLVLATGVAIGQVVGRAGPHSPFRNLLRLVNSSRLLRCLAPVAWVLFVGVGIAQADVYLGKDWWVKVQTEHVPWLAGTFVVSGTDRWSNPFSMVGNRIDIGRYEALGVFYVTGSTRLTRRGRNFGSNFYPTNPPSGPVLNGGSVEVYADSANRLTLHVLGSGQLGALHTRITFDGVRRAHVSGARFTGITSSFQEDGTSEIMSAYRVDKRNYKIPENSGSMTRSFTVTREFGVLGGGILQAPSILILLPSRTPRPGTLHKDFSADPADDNVRISLVKPVKSYVVEAR